MILISFNIRGMGTPAKKSKLREIFSKENVDFAMIQESKIANFNSSIIQSIWHSSNWEFSHIDAVGRSGGIISIWDCDKFSRRFTHSGPGFLIVEGFWLPNNLPCTFANVYAPCNSLDRKMLWDQISAILNSISGAICLAGDFNSVLSRSEKKGRNPNLSGSRHFREFISSNNLLDIPLANRKFTWMKHDSSAYSRLDRFLLNQHFSNLIGSCSQVALQRSVSDHCPIILKSSPSDWGPKPFRALNSWVSNSEFHNKVEEIWTSTEVLGYRGFVVKEKLKTLRKQLQLWNKQAFGDFNCQIHSHLNSINRLDLKGEVETLSEDEIILRKEDFIILWDLLKKKESLDAQKSRSRWIKQGDSNSRYFHNLMKFRKRKNGITGIHHHNSWLEDPPAVKEAIRSFFDNQFKEKASFRPSLQNLDFSSISMMEAISLEAEFSIDEIRAALKDCASDKAPGPDGFSFTIFKHIWQIVEKDVVDFILQFHRSNKIVKGLNSVFVVLIPKIANPTSLNDYRPISLIGCLYKILSKILSNRLKSVLPKVISPAQSAFISGRQIIDSALILNELVDEMKLKKKSGFIFKADFSKAFDCVSWGYLDSILVAMGFGSKWRAWISSCLSSSNISILVNGAATQSFNPSRGLRQGDPLSPFLFLIAAEGLNAMMRSATYRNLFSGIKIGCSNLEISLLQYADDTIIAGDYCWENIVAVKFILRWYEMASGLEINYKKSKLVSINCPSNWSHLAASKLGCRTESLPFSYLGLPIGSSPASARFWEPVISKIESKLSSWRRRLLSAGGRVTLVQSVLSALPLYFCSLFKMPVVVLSRINKILRNFFWGSNSNNNKIKWVAWNSVCLDKELGGLGLPVLKNRNIALLAKWWWRFGSEDSALWKDVVIAKYYNGRNQLGIENISSPRTSKLWGDILKIGSVLQGSSLVSTLRNQISWSVGNGTLTSFWCDAWLNNIYLRNSFPRIFAMAVNKQASIMQMVSWSNNTVSWNIDLQRPPRGRAISEFLALRSLLDSVSLNPALPDHISWNLTASKQFSVQSAYQFLCTGPRILQPDLLKVIWHRLIPPRIQVFAWRLSHDALPSKQNLLRRGVQISDYNCSLCNSAPESSSHLFIFCGQTSSLWDKILSWWNIPFTFPDSIQALIPQSASITLSKPVNYRLQQVFITTLWAIWFFRNHIVFRAKHWCTDEALHFIQSRSFIWAKELSSNHASFSDWVQFPLEVASSHFS